jgi:hypothetical protein
MLPLVALLLGASVSYLQCFPSASRPALVTRHAAVTRIGRLIVSAADEVPSDEKGPAETSSEQKRTRKESGASKKRKFDVMTSSSAAVVSSSSAAASAAGPTLNATAQAAVRPKSAEAEAIEKKVVDLAAAEKVMEEGANISAADRVIAAEKAEKAEAEKAAAAEAAVAKAAASKAAASKAAAAAAAKAADQLAAADKLASKWAADTRAAADKLAAEWAASEKAAVNKAAAEKAAVKNNQAAEKASVDWAAAKKASAERAAAERAMAEKASAERSAAEKAAANKATAERAAAAADAAWAQAAAAAAAEAAASEREKAAALALATASEREEATLRAELERMQIEYRRLREIHDEQNNYTAHVEAQLHAACMELDAAVATVQYLGMQEAMHGSEAMQGAAQGAIQGVMQGSMQQAMQQAMQAGVPSERQPAPPPVWPPWPSMQDSASAWPPAGGADVHPMQGAMSSQGAAASQGSMQSGFDGMMPPGMMPSGVMQSGMMPMPSDGGSPAESTVSDVAQARQRQVVVAVETALVSVRAMQLLVDEMAKNVPESVSESLTPPEPMALDRGVVVPSTAAPPIDEERRGRSPGLQKNFYDVPVADFRRPYGAPSGGAASGGALAEPAGGSGSAAELVAWAVPLLQAATVAAGKGVGEAAHKLAADMQSRSAMGQSGTSPSAVSEALQALETASATSSMMQDSVVPALLRAAKSKNQAARVGAELASELAFATVDVMQVAMAAAETAGYGRAELTTSSLIAVAEVMQTMLTGAQRLGRVKDWTSEGLTEAVGLTEADAISTRLEVEQQRARLTGARAILRGALRSNGGGARTPMQVAPAASVAAAAAEPMEEAKGADARREARMAAAGGGLRMPTPVGRSSFVAPTRSAPSTSVHTTLTQMQRQARSAAAAGAAGSVGAEPNADLRGADARRAARMADGRPLRYNFPPQPISKELRQATTATAAAPARASAALELRGADARREARTMYGVPMGNYLRGSQGNYDPMMPNSRGPMMRNYVLPGVPGMPMGTPGVAPGMQNPLMMQRQAGARLYGNAAVPTAPVPSARGNYVMRNMPGAPMQTMQMDPRFMGAEERRLARQMGRSDYYPPPY